MLVCEHFCKFSQRLLTSMFGVEKMCHAEAQCSEEDPTVLLLIHHQIQSWPHTSYVTILI